MKIEIKVNKLRELIKKYIEEEHCVTFTNNPPSVSVDYSELEGCQFLVALTVEGEFKMMDPK